jgi:hypothetical protein
MTADALTEARVLSRVCGIGEVGRLVGGDEPQGELNLTGLHSRSCC